MPDAEGVYVKIRGQHYVWRYYLTPWTTKEQIYCLRAGRVYLAHSKNVAKERDFYRLPHLTDHDLKVIELFAIQPSPARLQSLHRNLMNSFAVISRLRAAVTAAGADVPFYDELHRALEEAEINTEEELHGRIEREAIGFIQRMLRGDTSFFDRDDEAMSFLYFLCVQSFRTKQIKEALIARAAATGAPIDYSRIWNVLRHIFATNVGWSLYATRKEHRLVLLDNSTQTPLITGDQPIINTHAREDGTPPDRLEFYYPLSPTHAMLLTDNLEAFPRKRVCMTPGDVEKYNRLIFEMSHEQVFSNSNAYLEALRAG